jgi:hypothetical protein
MANKRKNGSTRTTKSRAGRPSLPPWELFHYETVTGPRECRWRRTERIRLNRISRRVLVTASNIPAPRLVTLQRPLEVIASGVGLTRTTARREPGGHCA